MEFLFVASFQMSFYYVVQAGQDLVILQLSFLYSGIRSMHQQSSLILNALPTLRRQLENCLEAATAYAPGMGTVGQSTVVDLGITFTISGFLMN